MLKDKGYVVDMNTDNFILTTEQIIEFLKQKKYDAVITLLTDHINSKVFDIFPKGSAFASLRIPVCFDSQYHYHSWVHNVQAIDRFQILDRLVPTLLWLLLEPLLLNGRHSQRHCHHHFLREYHALLQWLLDLFEEVV